MTNAARWSFNEPEMEVDLIQDAARRVVWLADQNSKIAKKVCIETFDEDLDKYLEGGLRRKEVSFFFLSDVPVGVNLFSNLAYRISANYEAEVSEEGSFFTRSGGVVAFYSTSVSNENLATAIISEQTGVSIEDIKSGNISERQFEALVSASSQMQKMPLFIDDRKDLTVSKLLSRAQDLKRKRGLDVIILENDSLFNMPEGQRAISERLVELLVGLANDLDIAIVCLMATDIAGRVKLSNGQTRKFYLDKSRTKGALRFGDLYLSHELNESEIRKPSPSALSVRDNDTSTNQEFLKRALELSESELDLEAASSVPTPSEIAAVLGGQIVLGRKINSAIDLARQVQDGLPSGALEEIARIGFSSTELDQLVAPKRTLARRRKNGRLIPVEGDTLVRIARIFLLSLRVFGSASAALEWLRTKQKKRLGGRSPIDLLATETGSDVIEEILLRAIYGFTA